MRSSGLVLFSCAGLLLSGGTILGGTVAWSLLRMTYFFWASDLGIELGSSILFLAGSLLCLPICWLSTLVPYHTKSLTMNATLIGVVSVAMLMMSLGMSSMSSLARAVREPSALNNSMFRALSLDGFDPAVRNAFSNMQLKLRCCGVQAHGDWYQHRRSLPPACCGRVWNRKRGDKCEVPLFTMGCLRPALIELRYFANTLSALSSALILVMAVTLFAATYMLVINEVERGKDRLYKSGTPPLRIGIACLAQPPQAPQSPHRLAFVESAMPPVGNVV